jgi:hypothetical protein
MPTTQRSAKTRVKGRKCVPGHSGAFVGNSAKSDGSAKARVFPVQATANMGLLM